MLKSIAKVILILSLVAVLLPLLWCVYAFCFVAGLTTTFWVALAVVAVICIVIVRKFLRGKK
jgi:hypothetical protein